LGGPFILSERLAYTIHTRSIQVNKRLAIQIVAKVGDGDESNLVRALADYGVKTDNPVGIVVRGDRVHAVYTGDYEGKIGRKRAAVVNKGAMFAAMDAGFSVLFHGGVNVR
jgi:hypothetical protein